MSGAAFGHGPNHLSAQTLHNVVTRNCPGTFVLGEHTDDGSHVDFVGRSDTDVNARLQRHIGKYRHFRFDYMMHAQAAYEEECSLYHAYRPDHNLSHPEPPIGPGWSCPRCRPHG